MQALEAVKWITGSGTTLVGRMLIFDALETEWREMQIQRDPGCPVCGDHPTQTGLIDYDVFCGVPAPVATVSASELAQALATDAPPALIDVREPVEWEAGNLEAEGARLIPLGDLALRVSEVPRGRPLVLYCQTGRRSEEAVRVLSAAGVHGARSLDGGIVAWMGRAAAVPARAGDRDGGD